MIKRQKTLNPLSDSKLHFTRSLGALETVCKPIQPTPKLRRVTYGSCRNLVKAEPPE